MPKPDGRYEVLAVRYGELRARRSELFYRYETYGEPDAEVEMAYYVWILRRDGETILVDTGFDVEAGVRRGRTCLRPPVDALRSAGIVPESVSTVVVTHFHYDHIGNLDAFPAAELVVPRRELEFWTGPFADRAHFAAHVEPSEIASVERAAQEGRVRLTEGTEEILDGVVAVSVGGHSPGQQVTVVGDVVLASDAIHFYEEYELQRPFAVMASLEEMYRAYDGIAELGSVVVPGHDPRVMERFEQVGDHVVRIG
jgi:glyoxylase-like metal-dependent hydrolase (beta-lactamase superfamily II)